MKLLLYCTKGKPYLIGRKNTLSPYYLDKGGRYSIMDGRDYIHNGKIVAECDFEVEEINSFYDDYDGGEFYTPSLNQEELLDESCLNIFEISEYLKYGFGCAIHIKNLNIFDEPKELIEYYNNGEEIRYLNSVWENYGLPDYDEYEEIQIKKAPQNMIYVFDNNEEKKVLISIHPEWLCKILNGEKTIEVRKKVLKEMLK